MHHWPSVKEIHCRLRFVTNNQPCVCVCVSVGLLSWCAVFSTEEYDAHRRLRYRLMRRVVVKSVAAIVGSIDPLARRKLGRRHQFPSICAFVVYGTVSGLLRAAKTRNIGALEKLDFKNKCN